MTKTKSKQKYKVTSKVHFPADAYWFVEPKNPKVITEKSERETYPFSEMKVGDSFFEHGVSARDMRGAICGASRRFQHRYFSRTVPGGARIWRHI